LEDGVVDGWENCKLDRRTSRRGGWREWTRVPRCANEPSEVWNRRARFQVVGENQMCTSNRRFSRLLTSVHTVNEAALAGAWDGQVKCVGEQVWALGDHCALSGPWCWPMSGGGPGVPWACKRLHVAGSSRRGPRSGSHTLAGVAAPPPLV
jgi:hypothetical protein